MTKNQILSYVLKTPENTNPQVLMSMLDSLVNSTAQPKDFSSATAAIKEGKNLIVANDIAAAGEITADGKVNVEVDLNGKKIEATAECSNWLLCAQNGAKMEIRGNGIVSSGKGQNTIPVSAYHDAKIDIYGGTYLCSEGAGECVYAENSIVRIYGGEYKMAEGEKQTELLNAKNGTSVESIQVYGGTFYGWSPEEGDDAMKGSFVAPGYKVIEIQPSVFKVVKA